jgi:hypothetical protein
MDAKPKKRELTPAAERALKEAEERRAAQKRAQEADRTPEIDGPKGLDPVRYGDWEKDGIASDF